MISRQISDNYFFFIVVFQNYHFLTKCFSKTVVFLLTFHSVKIPLNIRISQITIFSILNFYFSRYVPVAATSTFEFVCGAPLPYTYQFAVARFCHESMAVVQSNKPSKAVLTIDTQCGPGIPKNALDHPDILTNLTLEMMDGLTPKSTSTYRIRFNRSNPHTNLVKSQKQITLPSWKSPHNFTPSYSK